MLKTGDSVEVGEDRLMQSTERSLEPQDIALEILYEDEHFVVIDKPAGLVVHPGSGNRDGTVANALLFHIDSLSSGTEEDRPGIVHRLDKQTSGVLIAAKQDAAHAALAALFSERKVQKEYLGICIGARPKDSGSIDAPIGRGRNDPLRFSVRPNGRQARTDYRLCAHRGGISCIAIHPLTGRTHQIRVHCAWAGFPIVEDPQYGGDKKRVILLPPLDRPFAYKVFGCFDRHALHARRLSFVHPFTGKEVCFEAPLPEDFRSAVSLFGGLGEL
jgi:23S rRNA pseudouridine1911/1915/1917 synthase